MCSNKQSLYSFVPVNEHLHESLYVLVKYKKTASSLMDMCHKNIKNLPVTGYQGAEEVNCVIKASIISQLYFDIRDR